MKTTLLPAILSLSLSISAPAQSVLSIGSTTVIADTVVSGLDVPWEILYGSDDHIWMTERKGLVSRINPVSRTKILALDLTGPVFAMGEAGLLGMALHPDFPTQPEVFLVYTFGSMPTPYERLVKYTYSGGSLHTEQILLDSIPAYTSHNGSRLLFMDDKTLLMTTGDANNTALSQDSSSLNGKVLRLNPDGSIPSDNPFPGSYVYTLGHRNPQGLAKGPDGRFYISEHGQFTDDEFQILEPGRNYGWPDVEGFCDQPAEISYCNSHHIKEPVLNWSPTIAPSDLVYYSNNQFPELDQCFLMSVLKDKKLVAIRYDAATNTASQASYLVQMFERLRDICIGPEQEIYLATNGPSSANTSPGTHLLLVLRPAPALTGIIRQETGSEIQLYPTLVKDQLTVVRSATGGAYQLIIHDLSGKELRRQALANTREVLDLSSLEKGFYLVHVREGDRPVRQFRIVVAGE